MEAAGWTKGPPKTPSSRRKEYQSGHRHAGGRLRSAPGQGASSRGGGLCGRSHQAGKGAEVDRDGSCFGSKSGTAAHGGLSPKEITPFLRNLISEYNLGGVIHFARNVGELRRFAELNAELQELAGRSPSGAPLFSAVDQEGGTIARLTQGLAVAPAPWPWAPRAALNLPNRSVPPPPAT